MIFHLFAQLYQFNAQPTSSNKAQSGVLKDGEHLVHYILAKPLHTDVGSMGIPAFDQGKVLVSPVTHHIVHRDQMFVMGTYRVIII